MIFRRISVIFALLLMLAGALPTTAAGAAAPMASIASLGDENVALAGHLGGASMALAIRGSYAYAGMGPELAVLDISTPSRPARVGYVVVPQPISDIAVSGDYAYIAAGSAGLRIVDISDPARPTEVGHYDEIRDAGRVVVAGGFAYIVDAIAANDQDGLHIINVADPAAPVKASFYQVVLEDHLYAGTYLPSLGIVDSYLYVGWAACYAVGASNSCHGGLHILDVSNPSTPIKRGAYGSFPSMARGITIVGSYLYLAAGRMGMRVLDISMPVAPVEIGGYQLEYLSGDYAYDVAVAGGYAYIANGYNGILMLSIGDIAAPVKLRDIRLPDTVERITASAGYIHMSVGYEGYQILDVANPSAPKVIGVYNILAVSGSMALAGRYAYVGDVGGMRIVDVSNPANPISINTYDVTRFDDIDIEGRYVYLAGFEQGLQILDIVNPTAPIAIGALDTPGSAEGVAVQGGIAYVADGTSLQILDVANPKKPRALGAVSTLPYAQTVQVVGFYAFVGAEGGLQVVDITDPKAPQVVGLYALQARDAGYNLSIVGDYAYLATYTGLHIVNISNPRVPYEAGFFGMPDGSPLYTTSVVVAGAYAYIAAPGYGLLVLDVSRPAAPRQVGGYSATSASNVAVADGTVYLSASDQGLFILHQRYGVEGQVVDVMGRPVAGATVATNSGAAATTDASGLFRLANLASGTYMLTPSSPGFTFQPASATFTIPPEADRPIFTMLPALVSLTLTPGVASSLTYTSTQGLPIHLSFPAGVVSQTTQLTVAPLQGGQLPQFAFAGQAFVLTARRNGQPVPDLVFSQPVSVTLRYSDADVRVVEDEQQLMLWWSAGSGRRDAAQSCDTPTAYTRDPAHNTLGIAICRGGAFRLLGPTNQVFLPTITTRWSAT